MPRCYSTYQVNFTTRLRTTMSTTKPVDITLALQKVTEGFTDIVDRPIDTDIIDIRKLLFPVLMRTKYDELTLNHNLYGVIIPIDSYEHIYAKGTYSIPPVVASYDDTISIDATIT